MRRPGAEPAHETAPRGGVWRAAARALWEPAARLSDRSQRSTAALFAACLLVLVTAFGGYDSYLTLTRPGYVPPWGGYVLLLGAYGLVRAGHYYAAALLSLAIFPGVAFALVLWGLTPTPAVTLTLPILSVLLATLLVDAATTAALVLVSLALIVATVLVPAPHVTWSVAAGPLLVEALGGALGVLSIVHRTRLEAERRAALEIQASELERRVRERTAELAQTVEELESFSYSVSHDLRAPLRAIEGFAAILAEDHGDALGAEGRETLGVIRDSGARMSTLIDGLLRLSRVVRAPLERRVVDAAPLVREVMAALRAGAPGRAVTLRCPDTLPVVADPALLTTILENLLGNACKFTRGVSDAVIEVGAEVVDGRTRIVVRDNGAGFDMAHAARLFRPFERLHRDGEFPGTGIGLATVERAVRRHGGRIEATSRPGEGAVFAFDLGPDEPPKGQPMASQLTLTA